MVISLDKDIENFIKDKNVSGIYSNSSEVVNEALLLLKERDEKKQVLLCEIQKGIDDIETGRISTQTPKEIFNEVVAKRRATQQNSE